VVRKRGRRDRVTYWLAANILLRFITKTPADMADRARALLKRAEEGEFNLRIHPLVVAEVTWVLLSAYGYSKERVTEELVPVLELSALQVEEAPATIGALYLMSERNVDFVDAFLAEAARAGAEGVASFDRDFKKLNVAWLEP
jgi:predicted nucleic acid-binding protein